MMTHRFLPLVGVCLFAAGCPSARYIVADVTTQESSVADALVVTHCAENVSASGRSDSRGRVVTPLYSSVDAEKCIVTVAKTGFVTIEETGVKVCSKKDCEPTRYIIRRIGEAK